MENLQTQTESWKDIAGYEGSYQISNMGSIKRDGKFHKQHPSYQGYIKVTLYKDGKSKNHFVHRLIATAFIPNPLNLPFVNHKNGIKSDNRIENLEWCTRSENGKHAVETGLLDTSHFVGTNNSHNILTEKQVLQIYFLAHNTKLSAPTIASQFNISVHTVYSIKYKQNWKHILTEEKIKEYEVAAICALNEGDKATAQFQNTLRSAALVYPAELRNSFLF